MKRALFVALAVAAVGVVAAVAITADESPAVPQENAVTAFVNVNVIPMDEDRVLRDHTVVVRHGRIMEVGPARRVTVPAGATRIDGSGKYLMPGLSEMHGHTPVPGGNPDSDFVRNIMFLYVANGVTTVRGMLGAEGQLELKALANSGAIIGPTLYLAGPSFSGNSINSAEQAAARVREQHDAGWDLLKVHPGLTTDEYDAMAITAAEVGIRFGGHVPADVGIEHAIRMGQETFDHMDGYLQAFPDPSGPIDDGRLAELIRLTKAAGAWVVPTMVLWETVIGLGDPDEKGSWPEMEYWPGNGVSNWVNRHSNTRSSADFDEAANRRLAQNRMRLLKALSDAGVRILMGTDSPQRFSVPGFSIHREMQAMADAGMTPYQILKSGTRNVGEYFQREDSFGTVAVGRRADLILTNANPLADIANVSDRAGVMVRGQWLPEAMIQERLEQIAASMSN